MLNEIHTEEWLLLGSYAVCRRSRVQFQALQVVGLERGPLNIVRITEELFARKISGSSLENRDPQPWWPVALTTRHLLAKITINFADKWQSIDRDSSLAD
jgi:hypothetical protein